MAQLICGLPPQTIPSLAPSINQHIADTTLLLPLPRQTNQSTPDAAAHQLTPGSLALLPSSLQHHSNCLQAINKTIKQFSQHLKAEQLDRQSLQFILLQLQNDFALLRMNHQLTHPSLRGSIPNISSSTINFASLNLDIQMSLFGKFPQ